ncbi:MAG: hypothetical protein KIPDCIKN_04357 [Haliscomenobacter sp.]|nr:hypothetical protein [Haliscomenobacter sp.]
MIAWVKSRQAGGSTTCTLKVVIDAIETGEDWNMMSRSQRQSDELVEKATTHLKAIDTFVTRKYGYKPFLVKATAKVIELSNGAVIQPMPCDPDTTAGYTRNWFLDEAALYPHSVRLFACLRPSIMHGKRILIVSSFRGYRNAFGKIVHDWKKTGKSPYSIHVTPIDAAVADGLTLRDHQGNAVTLDEFLQIERQSMPEEMVQQEYFCKAIDDSEDLFGADMVGRCVMGNGREPVTTPGQLRERIAARIKDSRGSAEFPFGIDVGRYHDRTVLWFCEKIARAYYPLCIVDTRNEPLASQALLLREYIRAAVSTGGLCTGFIDRTGIGAGVAEPLIEEFPKIVEPMTFTNAVKGLLAGRIRRLMQDGNFWLPGDRQDIIEDFLSVRKLVSDAGNVRIGAPRGPDGHADYFWAAALAAHAGEAVPPFKIVVA